MSIIRYELCVCVCDELRQKNKTDVRMMDTIVIVNKNKEGESIKPMYLHFHIQNKAEIMWQP